jgi:hypothetical protein
MCVRSSRRRAWEGPGDGLTALSGHVAPRHAQAVLPQPDGPVAWPKPHEARAPDQHHVQRI